MEVKMAATTRILKKTQFRSFDRAVPYTPDVSSNQQGTGGHDEFAITIMLHIRP